MLRSTLTLGLITLLNTSLNAEKKETIMKELQTEIIIHSSIDTVWHHLTDFASYPNWNPFIVKLQGDLEHGSQLQTVMMNDGKERQFSPKVTLLKDGSQFEWLGSMPLRAFTGNHYFHLEKVNDATTRLIHGERFGGWLSGPIMKKIGEETRDGFIAMNEALKRRCEGSF